MERLLAPGLLVLLLPALTRGERRRRGPRSGRPGALRKFVESGAGRGGGPGPGWAPRGTAGTRTRRRRGVRDAGSPWEPGLGVAGCLGTELSSRGGTGARRRRGKRARNRWGSGSRHRGGVGEAGLRGGRGSASRRRWRGNGARGRREPEVGTGGCCGELRSLPLGEPELGTAGAGARDGLGVQGGRAPACCSARAFDRFANFSRFPVS